MGVTTPPSDPEVAGEQAALDHALSSLLAMRQRAERLLADLIAAGNPDLDYKSALARRVALLDEARDPFSSGESTRRTGRRGASVAATLRMRNPTRL